MVTARHGVVTISLMSLKPNGPEGVPKSKSNGQIIVS